jgi:Ca2+-binding RTX toxin-like protein
MHLRHVLRPSLAAVLAGAAVLVVPSASSADPPVYVSQLAIDHAWSNAVAGDGSVLVTGWTGPTFEATPGAHDTTWDGSSDAFAVKVDSTGRLEWATYLGGASDEDGGAIAEGPDGSVYVAGRSVPQHDDSGTPVAWFPTTEGALSRDYVSPYQGGHVGWLVKLSEDGSAVQWATLLPGVRHVLDLEVDEGGRAHLVGEAYADLPVTPDAFDTAPGPGGSSPDSDAVVATVSADGGSYAYASFVGGSESDQAIEVDLGPAGSTYVAGTTRSTDFPVTAGAYQTTSGGGYDGFVARIAADGSLDWSTYLGGQYGDGERVTGLAVDQQGGAVLSGRDPGHDFPVTEDAAWGTPYSTINSWAAQVTGDGSSLAWATNVPGGLQEVHLDRQGHTHLMTLGADPSTVEEGLHSWVTMIELDRQGLLRRAEAAPDQAVLDFDVDAAGSAYLVGGPRSTAARSASGSDPVALFSRVASCTVTGTEGDDLLTGTPGPDVICAGGGDDVVDGGGGHDVLVLGGGHDEVVAGSGVDVVRAGAGRDLVRGGADRDLLLGGPGADRLLGGGGDDTLVGGAGRDELRGGPGDDEPERAVVE